MPDKWRHEYIETLRGATVFVIADKESLDASTHSKPLRHYNGKTKSAAVIELPDSDGHSVKDASDWLAAGGSAGELAELLNAAQEWTPQTQTLAADLAAALDSICNFLQRYVKFSSPAQPTAIALWIAHT